MKNRNITTVPHLISKLAHDIRLARTLNNEAQAAAIEQRDLITSGRIVDAQARAAAVADDIMERRKTLVRIRLDTLKRLNLASKQINEAFEAVSKWTVEDPAGHQLKLCGAVVQGLDDAGLPDFEGFGPEVAVDTAGDEVRRKAATHGMDLGFLEQAIRTLAD